MNWNVFFSIKYFWLYPTFCIIVVSTLYTEIIQILIEWTIQMYINDRQWFQPEIILINIICFLSSIKFYQCRRISPQKQCLSSAITKTRCVFGFFFGGGHPVYGSCSERNGKPFQEWKFIISILTFAMESKDWQKIRKYLSEVVREIPFKYTYILP